MTIQAVKGKEDILFKVIQLAKDSRVAYEETYMKSSKNNGRRHGSSAKDIFEKVNSPEYAPIQEKEDALEDYMMSLDFEDIQWLQTLMYLGRDREYDESDSYEERFAKIYQDLNRSGWEDKRIEVRQMTEKGPLDIYLMNGSQIVGISF